MTSFHLFFFIYYELDDVTMKDAEAADKLGVSQLVVLLMQVNSKQTK